MRSLLSTVALLGATLLVAGCREVRTQGQTSRAATTDATTPQTRHVAPAAASRTIDITANDYAYTGLPVHAPAGWLMIRMTNAGTKPHMFAVGKIVNGLSVAAALDSVMHNRDPKLADWGGPNVISPGDTETTWTYFSPGQYVVGCFVESADGKIHAERGMAGSFDIVAAADSVGPPPANMTVTLSDYRIDVAGGEINAGTRIIKLYNAASQTHDFQIIKVLPGHTVAEALNWFEHPDREPSAAQAVGGESGISAGQEAEMTTTFTPGTYVLLCWMSTPASKQIVHFKLGMQRTLVIPAS